MVFRVIPLPSYHSSSIASGGSFALPTSAHVYLLVFSCLILPLLMVISPVRDLLYSEIGEQFVKERVGRRGMRPLIASLSAITFLFAWNDYTRAPLKGPDIEHWAELMAHGEKAVNEGCSPIDDQLETLQERSASLLKIDPESRDPALVEELSKERWSLFEERMARTRDISRKTTEMSHLAAQPKGEKDGVVSELSDRLKDFFRGKEKNRTFWVIDRALPGGLGLDQYNQAQEVLALQGNLQKNNELLGSLLKQGQIDGNSNANPDPNPSDKKPNSSTPNTDYNLLDPKAASKSDIK